MHPGDQEVLVFINSCGKFDDMLATELIFMNTILYWYTPTP